MVPQSAGELLAIRVVYRANAIYCIVELKLLRLYRWNQISQRTNWKHSLVLATRFLIRIYQHYPGTT